MAISFSRYVNISSGVAGASIVPTRSFVTRLMTDSLLVPPQTSLDFDTLADVATYFGTGGTEYAMAEVYFGFVSKQIISPPFLSFGRFVDTAVAPRIYGNTNAKLLATLQAISAGGFTLTLGGVALVATGLNFSAAADLPTVAADMQTKIRTGTGAVFTGATVTWNSGTNQFDFVGGATGASAIVLTDGAQGPLAALGWLSGPGLVVANGAAVETITQTLTNTVAYSNNFGSFDFVQTLTQSQITEAATWNDAQNVDFMFLADVPAATASAISAAILALSGTAMTLSPLATEFPEMLPGMIWAATDYTRRNAAQNYMYQQGPFTPSVSDDADANTYDGLRVNYYGATQTAGQAVEFYQRGFVTGGATDPTDMGVYANEAWFKDAAAVSLMNLFLAVTQVPANRTGRAMCLGVLQSDIDQAIFNGVIEVGKTLTVQQQIVITQFTGDPNAWRQVQTIGYWIDGTVVVTTNSSGAPEYDFDYTLVYSKGDSIRKVNGQDVLI